MHVLNITHRNLEREFSLHKEADKFMAISIIGGDIYPLIENIKPKVIVDVGANIGATSVFFGMSYPEALIFSFEPTTMNFDLLKKNTAKFSNVEAFQLGVLDEESTANMYLASMNPGTNTLFPDGRTFDEVEEVQFICLDDFLKSKGIEEVDILKIDTEGCELKILKSISDKLTAIKVIYLEHHTANHCDEIKSLLSNSHTLKRHRLCGSIALPPDANLVGRTSLDEVKVKGQIFLAKQQVIEQCHVDMLQRLDLPNLKVLSDELGEMCWLSNGLIS